MDTTFLKELGYEAVPHYKGGIALFKKYVDEFGFSLYPYGGGFRLSISFSFKGYKNGFFTEKEFLMVDSDTPIDSKDVLEKEERVLVERVVEETRRFLAFVEGKVHAYLAG